MSSQAVSKYIEGHQLGLFIVPHIIVVTSAILDRRPISPFPVLSSRYAACSICIFFNSGDIESIIFKLISYCDVWGV